MTEASTTSVQQIVIPDITILNPRSRNKRGFHELVESIRSVGLKKPITVSRNPGAAGYSLVCGQGRLEAFMMLGQTTIPAIVVKETEENCFVRSLVENLARRHPQPLELVREITTLRDRKYTMRQIATKTGFSEEYIVAIFSLLDKGEERLVVAVDKGIIPPTIAIEIARAKDGDIQQALADAYERKQFPGNQIMAIRRIVESRNVLGKSLKRSNDPHRSRKRVSATALVRAYQKEMDRQQALIKKATLTQARMLFVVTGLKRLLADDHFATLLRAEKFATLPAPLAERMRTGVLS